MDALVTILRKFLTAENLWELCNLGLICFLGCSFVMVLGNSRLMRQRLSRLGLDRKTTLFIKLETLRLGLCGSISICGAICTALLGIALSYDAASLSSGVAIGILALTVALTRVLYGGFCGSRQKLNDLFDEIVVQYRLAQTASEGSLPILGAESCSPADGDMQEPEDTPTGVCLKKPADKLDQDWVLEKSNGDWELFPPYLASEMGSLPALPNPSSISIVP